MSNPTGNQAQSGRDEEDREGELLCLKIKTQLEDLFSDSHLAEDGFLLKHVQKNRQGFVSLKLLTCLKKIKTLTTNWYMTLAGAEYSELLEVNDDSTKVRRIEPLPKWLLCSPTSKLLLAWEATEEETTGEEGETPGLVQPPLSDRILKKVSAHGNISSFWTVHPGKELPKELQCYGKRHKELGQRLCVVVKFDHLEEVRKVYNALKAEEKPDGGGLCVVPLGFQSMYNITKDEFSGDQPESIPSQENPLETSKDSVQEEPCAPAEVTDEAPDTREPSENSVQRTCERICSSYSSQRFSGLTQRYSKKNWCSGDYDKENTQSPWVLRRKSAASVLNPKAPLPVNAPFLMQRVLRQPFGPDGTKGFQSRGRQLQQICNYIT